MHHGYWIAAGVAAWLLVGAVVVGFDYGLDGDESRHPKKDGLGFIVFGFVIWPFLVLIMVMEGTMRYVRRRRLANRRKNEYLERP